MIVSLLYRARICLCGTASRGASWLSPAFDIVLECRSKDEEYGGIAGPIAAEMPSHFQPKGLSAKWCGGASIDWPSYHVDLVESD